MILFVCYIERKETAWCRTGGWGEVDARRLKKQEEEEKDILKQLIIIIQTMQKIAATI